MSNVTVTTTKQSISIVGSQSTKITNLSLANSGTEYSHSLTANLKQLIIRSRGIAKLQISFTNGESGTKYITIPKGSNLSLIDLDFISKTLYLQSDTNSTTVEILELY